MGPEAGELPFEVLRYRSMGLLMLGITVALQLRCVLAQVVPGRNALQPWLSETLTWSVSSLAVLLTLTVLSAVIIRIQLWNIAR
ncbi:hypothetical protein AAFF_G00134260 [Aldrovandia affinis]|uniref:Uncharacterized protein n=1 Tax=Aldrovandia affinis TaxID=143900 RepID=A0AAD7RQJ9_9TELE|nr:hypothetical protein AAFF_G00134260 [Aldrovandia affinis]